MKKPSVLTEERLEVNGQSPLETLVPNVCFTKLPAGIIKFDHRIDNMSYQRAPVRNTINRIADMWDEKAIGVIPVSLRADGTYWAMDGQQRTLGTIRRHGPQYEMEVELFRGLTRAEEADIFKKRNINRANIQTAIKTQAFEVSGDIELQRVLAILEKLNLKHDWFSNEPVARTIRCGLGLINLQRKHGAEDLERTLAFVEACWKWPKEATYERFIVGVHCFLRRHCDDPFYIDEEAKRKFSQCSANVIDLLGQEIRGNFRVGQKPTISEGIYRALVDTYNKGKRQRLEYRGDPRKKKPV